MNAGYSIILSRNMLREGKVVPEHVMDRMFTGFTTPTHSEFDEILFKFSP